MNLKETLNLVKPKGITDQYLEPISIYEDL